MPVKKTVDDCVEAVFYFASNNEIICSKSAIAYSILALALAIKENKNK